MTQRDFNEFEFSARLASAEMKLGDKELEVNGTLFCDRADELKYIVSWGFHGFDEREFDTLDPAIQFYNSLS